MNAEQNQAKVVTDESLEAAVKRFRQNSYWRGVYDNAPEKAKRLYALQFWPSVNVDLYDRCKDEFHPLVQAAQAALGVADLEYLIAQPAATAWRRGRGRITGSCWQQPRSERAEGRHRFRVEAGQPLVWRNRVVWRNRGKRHDVMI